ncbi:hypothetical protein EJ02DRAFT_456043, partial [Clathrospora elynae]
MGPVSTTLLDAFLRGRCLVLSSLANSGLSIPTKYGYHCIRSSHGFTSSLSPSWMVSCARFSIFSHTLSISLPTWSHATAVSVGKLLGAWLALAGLLDLEILRPWALD